MTDFETSIQTIVKAYNTSQEKNTALQNQLASVQKQLFTIQNEYKTFKDSYKQLQQQYQALQEERNWLQDEISSLQEEYSSLQDEYSKYRNDFKTYMLSNKEQLKIKKLEDEITTLKYNNHMLQDYINNNSIKREDKYKTILTCGYFIDYQTFVTLINTLFSCEQHALANVLIEMAQEQDKFMQEGIQR